MNTDVSWIASDDTRGAVTLDFVVKRVGRRDVTGAVWLPDASRPDAPLVLFGHGASGDRYQAPIPELAERFVDELQCPVLSLDGPVHGLREVAPGGEEAFLVEIARPEAIADMVDDWQVGIDVVLGRSEIGPRLLAYYGVSMGSAFGIPMLAERDDVIVSTLGLLGTTGALPHLRAPLLDAASRITHPVLFTMRLEDEYFDRAGCLELFDALASDNKRLHARPGPHRPEPPEQLNLSFEFMKRHVERGGHARV